MRIYITDEKAAGQWEVMTSPTTEAETQTGPPPPLMLAGIFNGLAGDLIASVFAEQIMKEPAGEAAGSGPSIMLPGRDFVATPKKASKG